MLGANAFRATIRPLDCRALLVSIYIRSVAQSTVPASPSDPVQVNRQGNDTLLREVAMISRLDDSEVFVRVLNS
jgi:hypothetical protein